MYLMVHEKGDKARTKMQASPLEYVDPAVPPQQPVPRTVLYGPCHNSIAWNPGWLCLTNFVDHVIIRIQLLYTQTFLFK